MRKSRELVRALEDLRIGLKKNTSQRASLTYADGLLETAVRIDANGHWHGAGRRAVSGDFGPNSAKNERLEIIYEIGRVKIGTMPSQRSGRVSVRLSLTAPRR